MGTLHPLAHVPSNLPDTHVVHINMRHAPVVKQYILLPKTAKVREWTGQGESKSALYRERSAIMMLRIFFCVTRHTDHIPEVV